MALLLFLGKKDIKVAGIFTKPQIGKAILIKNNKAKVITCLSCFALAMIKHDPERLLEKDSFYFTE